MAGEEVCLKKVSLVGCTAAGRERLLRQFKTELLIMARLHSPRTVRVLGVVSTDPRYLGLVMEYMSGGSVRNALDSGLDLAADVRRTWCSDIAAGMRYLYAQGVEHRDLKCANCLLTAEGRVKVVDFGLSRCEELRTQMTSTIAMNLKGTPAFMAPEMLEEQTFTEKSDVYSFAIILWQMAAKAVPFAGVAAVGGIETLVGLSLTESQLETYAFRTVLRAIGNSEPLRQRVLDAHSARLGQVRERASE